MTPEAFMNMLILGEADGWRYVDEESLGADGLVNDELRRAVLFCEKGDSKDPCVSSGAYIPNRPLYSLPAKYYAWADVIFRCIEEKGYDPRTD